MRVIGTAGHVDHGKSTLVHRLTGIDPDRLAEEKARGLTLDLGFAWLTLANKEKIGIVDVPGHRDFIENMLAGVGGIDAALLVIAADEGVMPQTREHLAILDLLGVERCIVVLSKIDLVDDEDWVDLVASDIRETLTPTQFAQAPIVPVSAYSGQGLDDLLAQLQVILQDLPPRLDRQQPRLPVDRVFTVDGFGTVVTGTLSGGTLNVGDVVEIQPHNQQARIRGLQSYKQSIETALQGSRVAVNLAGIDKQDIERGAVLAYPGQLQPTQMIDVYFRHLPDTNRPLKHNAQVKFFCGASESLAQVRLLNDEQLAPNQEGWLQLRLETSLPLTQGDRYILRYPSPAQTVGGGVVVNPRPVKRWKRFQEDVINQLEVRLDGSPEERLVQLAEAQEPVTMQSLQKELALSPDDVETLVSQALQAEQVIAIGKNAVWASAKVAHVTQQMMQLVADYHQRYPLRQGILREELRQRLGLDAGTMQAVLNATDITQDKGTIRHPQHEIRFDEAHQHHVERVEKMLLRQPYSPPSYRELCDATHEEVVQALLHLGDLVQIQTNMVFSRHAYETMVNETLKAIDTHGHVDVSMLRDAFDTSRKYAIAVLEHLDQQQITKRVGDQRVRGAKALS
jgi:selenocysteine-specific elongation factor